MSRLVSQNKAKKKNNKKLLSATVALQELNVYDAGQNFSSQPMFGVFLFFFFFFKKVMFGISCKLS